MQDWDSRIKILKTNIQNAREKFVISNLKLKEKSVSAPIESPENTDSIVVNEKKEDNPSGNKIYENKDPLSSIELLKKEDNVIDDKIKTEVKLGLTEEITNKIDVVILGMQYLKLWKFQRWMYLKLWKFQRWMYLKLWKFQRWMYLKLWKFQRWMYLKLWKFQRWMYLKLWKFQRWMYLKLWKFQRWMYLKLWKFQSVRSYLKEEPKIEISSDKKLDNLDEVGVKKTELELLEEKNENDLTEDEEDRMYELRRLRAQKSYE